MLSWENTTIKPILNPHQRTFLEDERRHKAMIETMEDTNIDEDDDSNDHIYMRRKQSVKDSGLLDRHDSFYSNTKSLLVMFQIMGVMPIHRNPNGMLPRTGYDWFSIQGFWAYFIYGLETVLVILVLLKRVKSFKQNTNQPFDEIIYNVIFISILLTHFLLPIASWRHGKQVAVFKNMWTTYQLKYFHTTGETIEFPQLYTVTWSLCIISWILSFVINISQYFSQTDFELWYILAYLHILAMLNSFCSLWYVNCTAFGIVSTALEKYLAHSLISEKSADKLADIRHLWVDLSLLMQQLGRAYSNMYGMYCLMIFFTNIISTYGLFSEIIDKGATFKELGLLVLVVYFMSILFVICNEAHYATEKVGLKFKWRLLTVNLTAVDNATQREVVLFLNAIQKNPPVMNLNGYAIVNRKLITSNISFMTTYLIVLLQFKLTLLRKAARKAEAMKH